jgi:hypothetical protein
LSSSLLTQKTSDFLVPIDTLPGKRRELEKPIRPIQSGGLHQGTLYEVIFKRVSQGKIIVSKKPDMSKVVWSEGQEAQREPFRQASAYATRAKYKRRAKRLNNRPCDLAISDYFQKKVKVIVGGLPLTQGSARQIGADGFSADASSAPGLVESLLHAK